MAFHLIGEDSAVRLSLGQVQNGLAPVYGTPIELKPVGREIRIDEDVREIPVGGMSERREKHRLGKARSRISIDVFVPKTGWTTFDTTLGTCLGRYARLEVKEESGMLPYKAWAGIVVGWGGRIPNADAQTETITLLCDAD